MTQPSDPTVPRPHVEPEARLSEVHIAAAAPVLPYASPTTDRDRPKPVPFYSRPLPTAVSALVLTGCWICAALSIPTWIAALPAPACVAWYLARRLRRAKRPPRRFIGGAAVAAVWATAWLLNCLRLYRDWTGWVDYVWIYNPPMRWSTYAAGAGVLAWWVCEIADAVWDRDRRRQPPPPSSSSSSPPPALPVPPEAP